MTEGHNSGEMPAKDREILFFINRRIYNEKLAAKKRADADLKNAAKGVKVDLGETGVDEIKAYEKAQTPEGLAKIQAARAAEDRVLGYLGVPVGTQFDLLSDRTPLKERAFRDGREAGLRGDTLSNPYNDASEEGQSYAEGWHEGQGDLFAGIKKKDDAARALEAELIKGNDDQDELEDEAA